MSLRHAAITEDQRTLSITANTWPLPEAEQDLVPKQGQIDEPLLSPSRCNLQNGNYLEVRVAYGRKDFHGSRWGVTNKPHQ